MSRLRVLSLFAGIGGIDLGLERAGMEIVAHSEIEPYACRVLAKHWPDVPNLGDITTLDAAPWVGRIDVIAGGFPCQDISLAGKGAGIIEGETRSGLWHEYARLVRELRPRYVIVENVAALLARGIDTVLGSLATLGYDAWWDCIPAASVAHLTDATAFSLSRLAPTLRRSIPTPRPCTGLRSSGANRTEIMRSLLPTPTASEGTGAQPNAGRTGGKSLREVMVPTPTAQDSANSRNATAIRSKPSTGNAGTTLLDFVDPTNGGRLVPGHMTASGLITTPVEDDTGARLAPYAQGGKALSLQVGGALNPEWVEWLMGFPAGWTDCAALETP